MAEIQMFVRTDRIILREHIDRDGPMLSLALTDKQAIRQALNTMNSHDDFILITGRFDRTSDRNRMPVAIFQREIDADNFQTLMGGPPEFRVAREVQVDGFNWKVLRVI